MDTSLVRNDKQQMEDQYVFPTAVSEEDLKEAGRRSSLNQLFGSRKIFLTSGQKHPERPDLQADVIIQNKALEHYSKGEQAMGRSQYDKAVTCFSKAMTLQPNQTQLHVSQAEAYLQLCDFQSATVCYKQACLLEPGSFHIRLAFIYHLQGQCLFDQGLFLEALGSFTKAAELKPDCRAYQMRSLVCLSALGRYSDCLKLVTDWLVSHRPEGDLYILRARLYKHLNQVTLCYYDVKSALALNPACPEAGALMAQLEESSERAREEASSRVLAGQLSQALSQINTALEHCPQDPRHYLLRGILYRRLKDFTASIEDLVLAVELSEEQAGGQARPTDSQEEPGAVQEEAQAQLVLTYNDFAVHCFSRGFYPEATLLLNNAIQEEKEERGLYLNRGDCFFKQGEWGFALADYQQAEEMSPGDPAVCLRLAVLHNTLGSHSYQEGRFQEAADSLSLAIQYNPRDSLYYENRAKAFHKTLNLEGAKQDAISTLVLDPTNQEVLPVLLSQFPGCCVCDVVSRVQLMDRIQTHISSSHQQSLCMGLEQMTLTNENTKNQSASQSESPTEAEEELPCVSQQELQSMVKSTLQVKQRVLSFLQHRPRLTYTGPRLGLLSSPPSAQWNRTVLP